MTYFTLTREIRVPAHKGASTNRRWPVVRRGSRDYLSRVHLVLWLLVLKAAFGFSRSDMPSVGGIRGDFRMKKEVFFSGKI